MEASSSSSDCGHSCSDDLEPQQHLPGFLPANNHHHHNQDHVQRPSPSPEPAARAQLKLKNRITTSLPIFNNCYTFVLLTCLFFLIVSSSAAAGCTPSFFGQDPEDKGTSAGVILDPVIKEASSFRLTCILRRNQPVKWTLNNREINDLLKYQLGFKEDIEYHSNKITTHMAVVNATKAHTGEYKCVPQCVEGSNAGLRVVVLVGDKPVVDAKAEVDLVTHRNILVRYGAAKSKIDIKCTARNVKSIGWVKGDRAAIENKIQLCSEKRTKASVEETVEHFKSHRQTPCTEESEKDVLNGTQRVKEKKSVLRLPFLRQEDFGNYTCFSLPPDSPSGGVSTFFTTFILRHQVVRLKRSHPASGQMGVVNGYRANRTKQQNFRVFHQWDRGIRSVQAIEGNKLQIFCNTTGPENTKITWYRDDVLLPMDDDRYLKEEGIVLVKGETKSWFEITSAQHKHRGWYKCEATHDGKSEDAKFYVRVKDKLMPLWPFLGICGEVTLLCLIIVIYEKRRNKAELEEADTDESPDQ